MYRIRPNVVVRDAGSIPWLTGDYLQTAAGRSLSDAQHASEAIIGTQTGKNRREPSDSPVMRMLFRYRIRPNVAMRGVGAIP